MILLPFIMIIAVILGFHFSIDLIIHAFPSTHDLFSNNYIAYAIFGFAVFLGCPWFICIPIALVLGLIFADVWYAPLIQFVALEFVFYLFSAVVTFVIGGTIIASSSIYEKCKNKLLDNKKVYDSCEDVIDITSNSSSDKEGKLKNFFSFKGRIDRKTFMARTFILWIGFAIWALVLLVKVKFIIVIDMIFFVLLIIFQMSSIVRRLHDMNQSGWWCLVIIIMQGIISRQNDGVGLILSLAITLILALIKGTEGANSYGNRN